MNVLLTGGAGFIGSHVYVALAEAGHKPIILDNFVNSDIRVSQMLEKITNQPTPVVVSDLRETDKVKEALIKYSIEAVIHLAGLKAVGESAEQPIDYYDANVCGSISLLKAMAATNVKRLIFSSSATVYGDPKYLPINEEHPVAPTNPYGKTKLIIEQIIEDACRADNKLQACILRYFNPAGAHESGLIGENPKGLPNNLFPFLVKVALGELSELKIYGDDYATYDGTGIRDYIHVLDLAKGHQQALEALDKLPRSVKLNLGTGAGNSVLEIVEAFSRVSNTKIPYIFVGRRLGDIQTSYAGVEKADSLIGFKSNYGLEEICESAWKFAENNSKKS
jgi:UDP-glucose 4-epimerase